MVKKILLLGALLIVAILVSGCFCCCNPDSRTYSPPYKITKKPTAHPSIVPIIVPIIVQPCPVPTPVNATAVPTVNATPVK